MLKIQTIGRKNTKERMILLYGEAEGSKRYNQYIEKQRNKKVNKTNGSQRAVTLENLTNKWGKKFGRRFFNQYKETQKYAGSSLEYFI